MIRRNCQTFCHCHASVQVLLQCPILLDNTPVSKCDWSASRHPRQDRRRGGIPLLRRTLRRAYVPNATGKTKLDRDCRNQTVVHHAPRFIALKVLRPFFLATYGSMITRVGAVRLRGTCGSVAGPTSVTSWAVHTSVRLPLRDRFAVEIEYARTWGSVRLCHTNERGRYPHAPSPFIPPKLELAEHDDTRTQALQRLCRTLSSAPAESTCASLALSPPRTSSHREHPLAPPTTLCPRAPPEITLVALPTCVS